MTSPDYLDGWRSGFLAGVDHATRALAAVSGATPKAAPDWPTATESTAGVEVNRFSVLSGCWPRPRPRCGFACRCETIPSAWVPGSVTR